MSSRCLPILLVLAFAAFMGLVMLVGLLLLPLVKERTTPLRSRVIDRPLLLSQTTPSGEILPDGTAQEGDLLGQTFRVPTGEASASLHVATEDRRFLHRLTLTNRGGGRIADLHIREPNRDWSSARAILDTILETRKPVDDREAALSIFDYVHDHLERDPFRSEWDCFDVWKVFNCYGMGHCEVHARTLAALWEMAGLASVISNVAFKPGLNLLDHTMAEVFYDGAWHLFDSHGSNFFLSPDNRSVIGWRELDAEPALIARSGPVGDSFQAIDHTLWMDPAAYSWSFDRKISRTGTWKGELPPSWDLRSGDRAVLERDGNGAYVDNSRVHAPPRVPYSRATFETTLPNETAGWLGVDLVEGFREDREGKLVIRSGRSGVLRREIRTPFPIVSATVTLELSMEGEGGLAVLQMAPLGPPERGIETIESFEGQGNWSRAIPLEPWWDNWNEPYVRYGCAVILSATAPDSGEASLSSIRLVTVCQMATNALPDMLSSPWIVSVSPTAEGEIEFEVESLPHPSDLAPPTGLKASRVASRRDAWVELGWSAGVVEMGPDRWWEVDLSDDPDFRWTMLPYLTHRKDPRDSTFRAPLDLFPEETPFYLRVRARNRTGLASEWSETLEFIPRPLE